jgi:hypothetical protein
MYFHYTSIDALVQIIKGRKVWFSSLAFMNDEMEGFDTGEVLSLAAANLEGSEKETYIGLVSTTVEIFVRWQFCFSATTLKDDLSQWRGYSPLGQGACLEFDDRLFSDTAIRKVTCVYRDDEKLKVLQENSRLSATGQALNAILGEHEGLDKYIHEFVDALSRFKHRSFEPEQETRWIVSKAGLSEASDELKFRPHRLGLVSYLEIPIDVNGMKTITLGPQVPRQNQKTIDDFCMQQQCPAIVIESEVTLR